MTVLRCQGRSDRKAVDKMDILEINNFLKQGKTVKEVRDILGYSEKSYQKKIKELGYKYTKRKNNTY